MITPRANEQGLRNTPEEQRRAKHLVQAAAIATKARALLPKPLRLMQQLTQHSVNSSAG